MNIRPYLDKNNLHHAYLLEGIHQQIAPAITEFLEDFGVQTSGNPDFFRMHFDSFKIEDARDLKSKSFEKNFFNGSVETDKVLKSKKIFIISANNFLIEAQNALLKIFEEPITDTHFFLIVPDKNILLKTLFSRFYFIPARILAESSLSETQKEELKKARNFAQMSVQDRIIFIKELIENKKTKEENVLLPDFGRFKALQFLNSLEAMCHKIRCQTCKNNDKKAWCVNCSDFFQHIFKVREFLHQPGSSVKSLMESVALMMPIF